MEVVRCPWAKQEIELEYHDHEWGKPVYEDNKLFELLILEGMQAGLSWITILNKRETMGKAFDGFDPQIICNYDDKKKEDLLKDAGIIRNRRKIDALVGNAKAFLEIQKEFGSFRDYIWSFVDGKPMIHHVERMEDVPVNNEISDTMSKDLKKRGFRFVGSTICYSFMQAAGLVNDHFINCSFRDSMDV
ncbi:MAG TPA: DNA-3-methyladenine glycosylase I [Candidatus Merdenecus merdavium]|nr:DNA-3-methyladenine glycosylase I [Candidatus Merdenecus merdavium]